MFSFQVLPDLLVVAQQAQQGAPPPWWQVLGGILGLPTIAFTAVVTYRTIKKTGLESRKLELEIEEKRRALRETPESDAAAGARILADPVLDARLIQDIILRFILLFLFLQVWDIVQRLFNLVVTGTAAGLGAFRGDLSTPLVATISLLQAIPSVAFWLILIALGWPIFRDISRMLNLELPPWLSRDDSAQLRVLKVGVIGVILASSVAGPLLSSIG